MLTEGLPIYKSTYDFLLEVFLFSRSFIREYKYTIGQELKNETIQLMLSIFRANSSLEKRSLFLEDAKGHLETVRLLLRITKDLRQISLKSFVSLSEKLEGISKQLAGWQTHSRKVGC